MRLAALVLIASLGALAGCSGGDDQRREDAPPAPSAPGATDPEPPASAAPPEPPAIRFPRARGISVPRGFRAEVFARGLESPTAMAYGPDARLYVTEEVGRVVVVAPRSTRPRAFASGFDTPLGLAWRGRTLYVSSQGQVDRLRLSGGRAAGRRTLLSGLPYGLHQQDNVVVGPDDRLYLGSGSTCNACRERDRRSAAILAFGPDGRGLRVVATGLRNPYGLAFRPRTEELYVSVNGRDDLPNPSAPEPAELLVRFERGADYGWPACWPSWRHKRMVGACGGVTRPVAYLEPHSAPGAIAFPTGDAFPRRFREGVFVALWGQYASERYGRRVDFVALADDGRAAEPRPFADGFAHPLAVAFDRHGALLVADWEQGIIYRIQARGQP